MSSGLPFQSGLARRLVDTVRRRWSEDRRNGMIARAKSTKLPLEHRIAEWTLLRTYAPVLVYIAIGAGVAIVTMWLLGFKKLPGGDAGRPDKIWYSVVEQHGLASVRASIYALSRIDETSRSQLFQNDAEALQQMISVWLKEVGDKRLTLQFLQALASNREELSEIANLERMTIYHDGILNDMKKILQTKIEQQKSQWYAAQVMIQRHAVANKACTTHWTSLNNCLSNATRKN